MAGEPQDIRSTARTGPSRAKRSLNDESIEIHPFHYRPCEHLQVRRTDRIRPGVLHVNAAQDQSGARYLRLGHEPEDAVRG